MSADRDPVIDPGEKVIRRAWFALPWFALVLAGVLAWLFVLGGGR